MTDSQKHQPDALYTVDQLHDIIAGLPVIVYHLCLLPKPHFAYVSHGVELMIGYTPQEHYDDPGLGSKLMHPDDANIMMEALQKQSADPITTRWKKKDGTWIWTHTHLFYHLDHEGNLEAITGLAVDVSHYMREVILLQQGRDMMQAASELGRMGAWEYDLRDESTYWSKELYGIFGVQEPDSPLGLEVRDVDNNLKMYDPEYRALVKEAFEACRNEGINYDLVAHITNKEGRKLWIRTMAKAVVENGKILRIVGNVIDITPSKEVSDALAASEERYHMASLATNDVVWEVDFEKGTTIFSERCPQVFGWEDLCEPHEGYGLWLERVHKIDRPMVKASFEEAIANPEKTYWEYSYRFEKADASYAYVLDKAYIKRSNLGKAIRMVGSMRDISEQSLSQKSLRIQSRISLYLSRSNNLIEAAQYILEQLMRLDGIDAGAIYLYRNEDACLEMVAHKNISAQAYDEVKVLNPGDPTYEKLRSGIMIHRDWEEHKKADLPYLQNEGFRATLVIPFVHKNIPLATLHLASRENDYIPQSVRLVIHNIFSNVGDAILRIRAEESLSSSEKRFRTLFEGMMEGFALHRIILDDEGKPTDYSFLMVNPAFERMTGLKADNLLGKRVLDVLPETERYWIENYGRIALGDPPTVLEDYSKALDKHFRVIVYSPEPMLFATLVVDVTRMRQTAEELEIAKEKAQESKRIKQAFLSSMNHELRTPLNHIMGLSSLLQESTDPDEVKSFARLINQSGLHLLQLIEDIFDLTLAKDSTLKVSAREVDCLEYYQLNRNNLEEIHKDSGRQDSIQLIFSPDLSAQGQSICIDSAKVNQVLSNLMRNAIKFSDKGEVEFGFKLIENKRILFHVRDTGIGIPPEKQDLIFDLFRQVDETNTRAFGGVGIGLAISKRLTEIMGGKLYFDTTLNVGTTFYLEVPTDNPPSQGTPGLNRASKRKIPDLSKKNILLVEDDEVSSILVQLLLAKTNAYVINLREPNKTIATLEQEDMINLVLMNKKIGQVQANELAGQIKQLRPNMPVMALSANLRFKDDINPEDRIFDSIVTVPINHDIFFRELKRLLKGTK